MSFLGSLLELLSPQERERAEMRAIAKGGDLLGETCNVILEGINERYRRNNSKIYAADGREGQYTGVLDR